jgi:spermine oxidase
VAQLEGKGCKTIFKTRHRREIHLDKKVVNIEWNKSEKITATCSDGQSLQADYVIVTVSLGVLKKTHSTLFNPELPVRKQLVIDEMDFEGVGKIFLKFEEKFWPDDWVGFSLLWKEADLKEIDGTFIYW